jgi:hypothetical protein
VDLRVIVWEMEFYGSCMGKEILGYLYGKRNFRVVVWEKEFYGSCMGKGILW